MTSIVAPGRIYTIMVDEGIGDFLWVKDANDSCIVGSSLGGVADAPYDEKQMKSLMSESLFVDLCAWAMPFLRAERDDRGVLINFDWNGFDSSGVELAKRLKTELGDGVGVQYVRAHGNEEWGRLVIGV